MFKKLFGKKEEAGLSSSFSNMQVGQARVVGKMSDYLEFLEENIQVIPFLYDDSDASNLATKQKIFQAAFYTALFGVEKSCYYMAYLSHAGVYISKNPIKAAVWLHIGKNLADQNCTKLLAGVKLNDGLMDNYVLRSSPPSQEIIDAYLAAIVENKQLHTKDFVQDLSSTVITDKQLHLAFSRFFNSFNLQMLYYEDEMLALENMEVMQTEDFNERIAYPEFFPAPQPSGSGKMLTKDKTTVADPELQQEALTKYSTNYDRYKNIFDQYHPVFLQIKQEAVRIESFTFPDTSRAISNKMKQIMDYHEPLIGGEVARKVKAKYYNYSAQEMKHGAPAQYYDDQYSQKWDDLYSSEERKIQAPLEKAEKQINGKKALLQNKVTTLKSLDSSIEKKLKDENKLLNDAKLTQKNLDRMQEIDAKLEAYCNQYARLIPETQNYEQKIANEIPHIINHANSYMRSWDARDLAGMPSTQEEMDAAPSCTIC
jgi:hypothetical protein